METGLDLASRETLLAVIAEQQGVITGQQGVIAELRQRVESLEARLSGGGLGARMPGHKPAAKRKKPAEQEKKPRKKRQHGFARPRMEPAVRVVSRASTRCTTAAERNCPTGAMTRESRGSSKQGDPSGT